MYRQEEPEVNLEQLLERIRAFFGRFRIGGGGGAVVYFLVALILVAGVVWVGTGFYTVAPAEKAALRLFGKFDQEQGPGLHWFWLTVKLPDRSRLRDSDSIDNCHNLLNIHTTLKSYATFRNTVQNVSRTTPAMCRRSVVGSDPTPVDAR